MAHHLSSYFYCLKSIKLATYNVIAKDKKFKMMNASLNFSLAAWYVW
jgi:hypothetical protein